MSETKPLIPRNLSRRDLLQRAAVAMPASWLATAAFAHEFSGTADGGVIAGIDPKNLVDEYSARQLDQISDAELYRQITQIVAPPRRRGTSFSIHAPLEVMARYGLLPLVEPTRRSLARLQLVATATMYGNGLTPAPALDSIDPFPSLEIAKRHIAQTLRNRDATALEAIVMRMASQFGTASLVQTLTPLALPTMAGASHSHIGLWLLLRHGGITGPGDVALLRTAVRSLAKNPQQRLSSFGGMSVDGGGEPLKRTPAEIERDILRKLTQPPKVVSPSRSIMSQLMATEAAGHVESMFGDLISHDLTDEQIDAAFRAVLRVSAHSMLQDDLGHAKFGWSHGLTLPQAACGLSSFNINRKLALASTLVWITSRRCISGNVPLDFNWAPELLNNPVSLTEALRISPQAAASHVWHADGSERPQIVQTLATEASIRNDQHLVKYVRACLDLRSFDPRHQTLYLAAAAHLCGLWVGERPEKQILDNLLTGRVTRR